MGRIAAFFIIVIVIAFSAILFLNQNNNEQTNISITPSPRDDPNRLKHTTVTQEQLQTATPSPTKQAAQRLIHATIKTNKGNIELTLYPNDAPNTVKNFALKSQSGFYNNLIFHRVEDWVIQGGDPKSNGTGGESMKTELNDKPFVTGSLGVARGGDINVSNDAQFFIVKKDADWLNKQYTNFGIVTSGMDVVSQIQIGDKIVGITVE